MGSAGEMNLVVEILDPDTKQCVLKKDVVKIVVSTSR